MLGQTLESFAKLNVPETVELEVLVVDNNSTDETKASVESFQGQLPIKYVFESRQGHSVSRNTAIDNSTGDLMIWTDNDVIVDPGWLKGYVEGARKHSSSDFFGGAIEPVFESGKPDWLEATWEKCRAVYAYRNLGKKDFELAENQFPYGANFAVRNNVQKKFRFDEATGRSKDSLLGDDEISMLKNLVKAGHSGTWLGSVGVRHVITAERATADYVAKYFEGQGQSNVQNGRPTFAGSMQAFWIGKFNALCYRWKRGSRPADEWVSHLIRSSIACGERKQHRRKP